MPYLRPHARPPAPFLIPLTTLARRRHSQHKNFCRRRRKNTPKKDRARTRCNYCEDKRAGVHWTKRSKKGCARLATCIARQYAPRRPGELRGEHGGRCDRHPSSRPCDC